MKQIVAAIYVIPWLCVVMPVVGADKPMVVELWPGKPPDEAGDIGPEKVRPSPKHTKKEVEVTEPTRLLTNVSKPTITVCRPPKDKDTGAAVLICPGGGYWDLYWELEGEEVAAWLNSQGITGIILKYRVPRHADEPKGEPARRPLQDAQRAVSLVRSKAKEWSIDPKRIGMVGFSAGGHLAIATATSFEKRTYEAIDDVDKVSCRPDFAIAAYPGYLKFKDKDELAPHLRIPADTPPIFLVHGGADIISPPEHSVLMYLALRRAGIPAELHVYAGAAHDFGVRKVDHPCSKWTEHCVAWMANQGFLAPTKGSVDEGTEQLPIRHILPQHGQAKMPDHRVHLSRRHSYPPWPAASDLYLSLPGQSRIYTLFSSVERASLQALGQPAKVGPRCDAKEFFLIRSAHCQAITQICTAFAICDPCQLARSRRAGKQVLWLKALRNA